MKESLLLDELPDINSFHDYLLAFGGHLADLTNGKITAEDFWRLTNGDFEMLRAGICCESSSAGEFTQFIRMSFPKISERSIAKHVQSRHEQEERAKRFFAQNGLGEFDPYYYMVLCNDGEFIPFFDIKNLENILRTREIIVAYYQFMIDENGKANAYEKMMTANT